MKTFLLNLFQDHILYNELYLLDEKIALADQIDCLKEDLLQVESPDANYVLDVGWYPEFNIKGQFKIIIIRKYDWEHSIFMRECSSISTLKRILLECKSVMQNSYTNKHLS